MPLQILRLLACIALAFASCQKKRDVVLTPEQEAEYARMMNRPKPTYDELQRENDELKYREQQRALDK